MSKLNYLEHRHDDRVQPSSIDFTINLIYSKLMTPYQYNLNRAEQMNKSRILLEAVDQRQRDRTQIERLTAEVATLRAQIERQSA